MYKTNIQYIKCWSIGIECLSPLPLHEMSEVVDALEIDPAVVKVATEVLSGKWFFGFFSPPFHTGIYTPEI